MTFLIGFMGFLGIMIVAMLFTSLSYVMLEKIKLPIFQVIVFILGFLAIVLVSEGWQELMYFLFKVR